MRKLLLITCILPFCASTAAEEWTWAERLPVGSTLPAFTALNTEGEKTGSEALMGSNGLLLLFNRSVVW